MTNGIASTTGSDSPSRMVATPLPLTTIFGLHRVRSKRVASINDQIEAINQRIAWAQQRIAEADEADADKVVGWQRGIAMLTAQLEVVNRGDEAARRANVEEEVRLHILDKRLKEKVASELTDKLTGKTLDEQIEILRSSNKVGFLKRIFGRK